MQDMFRFGTRLLMVAALVFAHSAMAGQAAGSVIEGSKAYGLDSCVEPTPLMRKKHYAFLTHDRDITVHQGVRTIKHSLAGCVDCHAAKDDVGEYVPVTAEGQFCQSCHEYAGVELPCFSCHSATPTKATKAGD